MKEDVISILIYAVGALVIIAVGFMMFSYNAMLNQFVGSDFMLWAFLPLIGIGIIIMGFARIIDLLNQINNKLNKD